MGSNVEIPNRKGLLRRIIIIIFLITTSEVKTVMQANSTATQKKDKPKGKKHHVKRDEEKL